MNPSGFNGNVTDGFVLKGWSLGQFPLQVQDRKTSCLLGLLIEKIPSKTMVFRGKTLNLGGGFKYFSFSPRTLGEDSHFDYNMFVEKNWRE